MAAISQKNLDVISASCHTMFSLLSKLREEFGQATFFTATDGNHGRGVAWAANRLGQKQL